LGFYRDWSVYSGLSVERSLDGWTALFLLTTVATSVTGFMFPFHKLLPSHLVGAISLVVLSIAILARYSATSPAAGAGLT